MLVWETVASSTPQWMNEGPMKNLIIYRRHLQSLGSRTVDLPLKKTSSGAKLRIIVAQQQQHQMDPAFQQQQICVLLFVVSEGRGT